MASLVRPDKTEVKWHSFAGRGREDATAIDLNLVPQVVEFEGFINYGSPINAVGVNTIAGALTTSVPVLLTENVINQPVFSTRKRERL